MIFTNNKCSEIMKTKQIEKMGRHNVGEDGETELTRIYIVISSKFGTQKSSRKEMNSR